MKRIAIVAVVLVMGLSVLSCSSTGYNTQKGAAIGAGLGAIAGQAIGRNTAGTLIGAAGGALAGAIVGNSVDQDESNRRLERIEQRHGAYATPQPAPQPQAQMAPQGSTENPPGQWVMVPGQWVGGKWVPAHKVWTPVNP